MLHPLPKPRPAEIKPIVVVVQPSKNTEINNERSKDERPSMKDFEKLQAKVIELERKLLELTAQFDH